MPPAPLEAGNCGEPHHLHRQVQGEDANHGEGRPADGGLCDPKGLESDSSFRIFALLT